MPGIVTDAGVCCRYRGLLLALGIIEDDEDCDRYWDYRCRGLLLSSMITINA